MDRVPNENSQLFLKAQSSQNLSDNSINRNHYLPPPPMAGVPSDYEENGRVYHGYRKGSYMYPCDDVRSRP